MFTKSMDKRVKFILVMASLLACMGVLVSVSMANMDPISVGLVVSNYPNPFDSRNQFTTISCSFSREGRGRLVIYDLFGNMVRAYPLESNGTGSNQVIWDGTNELGQKVAKGGYICVVELLTNSNTILATRKIGVIH